MIRIKLSFLNLFKRKKIKLGDRVKLWGGYSTNPEWLSGKDAYYGEVIGFISGPYKNEDVIVRLDEEISFSNIKGKILILTLRYKGAVWGKAEIVHLHLSDSIPQGDKWCVDKDEWDRSHIESHASYRILGKIPGNS